MEKGLTAGVAMDVVTKSGTNEIHGTLYGFHSDNVLDASNVFYPGNLPKAKHIVNQDGGTIGGPIKKNKLFFFANWDGLFERNNYSSQATVVPVADGTSISNWRGGDFSSALGAPLFDTNGNPIMVTTTEGTQVQLQQGMVFDPTTGGLDGSNRAVFSSNGQLNVIPSSRLNQNVQNYWQLVPTPNFFPQGHIFNTNTIGNYFISTTQKYTRNIFTGKIDWNRNDKHTIWGKWEGQDFNAVDPSWYGAAGGGYSTGKGHQFAQTMTIGHTWTVSPSMVVTGHVGFERMAENSQPPSFGKPLGETLLGIPQANSPDGNPLYTGLPGIYMSGFSTLGDANSWQPVFRNDWTLTTSHNVTMIRGHHEIRFGVDLSHNHLNHFQPEIYCCPRGYLLFGEGGSSLDMPTDAAYDQMPVYTKTSGTLTAAGTGFASDRQNAVALMDLGVTSGTDKSKQYIKNTAKDTQFGLYIGDRWKVTPKFTADVGVRYEYFPLIVRDGADKFELFDPSLAGLPCPGGTGLCPETLLGGLGGNPIHLGQTSSKKLFTPRIGLAYQLNDKMVLRAGFGISNDTEPLERPLRGFFPLALGAQNVVPPSADVVPGQVDNSNYSGYLNLGTFADGIPLIQDPDISAGKVGTPNNVDAGTLAPGEFKRGYVESWNFFVERQLPGQFLLNVGYVGNSFIHEMNGANINAATLGGGASTQPIYAKFGRTAGSYWFMGYENSHYNSLQVSLNRKFAKGLFVQGSYTYSKAIDYLDDNSWENGLRFNCPGCGAMNRGTANFDHTHMLKMAYVYELPMGAGKRYTNTNKAARAILGGWQLSGVFSAWNGIPLQPGYSTSRLHTPGTSQDPDQVPGVALKSGFPATGSSPAYQKAGCLQGEGNGQCWFNPLAFAPVLDNNRFGTVGRQPSWLRGPGLVQMDQSLFRNFKLTERFNLQARLETQNLTNSPHFNTPNMTCSDVLGQCAGGFGQITGGYGERYVQIGLKLKF